MRQEEKRIRRSGEKIKNFLIPSCLITSFNFPSYRRLSLCLPGPALAVLPKTRGGNWPHSSHTWSWI